MQTNTHYRPAGLLRRIAAMFYDSLLIIAILIIATYLLLPFTHGQAIEAGNVWYQIYLLLIIVGFYGGFWYFRGQTLGMLAWHMKLYSMHGGEVTFKQIFIRFTVACISILCFGIGLLWVFTNKQRRSLYDFASNTVIRAITPQ